jgi:PTS system glucitol/sorbitol-specific IIA component
MGQGHVTRVIKYQANITAIGPLVSEFVEGGVLVFFGQNAPPELAEFSILHDGTTLVGEVAPGDRLSLDGNAYRVLAVGTVANQNLGALGHLVVKFNGQTVPEMPGDVCTEAAPLPAVEVGMRFQIETTENG